MIDCVPIYLTLMYELMHFQNFYLFWTAFSTGPFLLAVFMATQNNCFQIAIIILAVPYMLTRHLLVVVIRRLGTAKKPGLTSGLNKALTNRGIRLFEGKISEPKV